MSEIEILLVEDNPGDILLTKEALKEAKIHNSLSVAHDGVEAMAFLRKEGEFANAPRFMPLPSEFPTITSTFTPSLFQMFKTSA